MKSGLYSGDVRHARPGKLGAPAPSPATSEQADTCRRGAGAPRHKLHYRVFMLALDLDELPVLDRKLRFFSHNRFNVMTLFDRDHASFTDAPLKPQIETKLREAGIGWEGGEIMLLCMPRLLNYVFNPLSIYSCRRRSGELAALVHEVRNTFGEHHFYVLPASEGANGQVAQACTKDFFVSPFLEMDLRYEIRIAPPRGEASENAVVAMTVRRGADVALTASFAGQRQELSDSALLRAFLANPLMTFTAIAGIHWEALKMIAKGVRYLGRPRREPEAIEERAL